MKSGPHVVAKLKHVIATIIINTVRYFFIESRKKKLEYIRKLPIPFPYLFY